MEKIYIISDQNEKDTTSSIYEYIDIRGENLLEDWQFHDYVISIFKNKKILRLVIPLTINDASFQGLRLGLHIRLNNKLNFEQKSIPILFTSDRFTFENIFSNPTLPIKNDRSLPHYLLLTPNIYLEKNNLDIIQKIFDISTPMSQSEYQNKFLNAIKILPAESLGKHSLANLWGAFQLAKTTGNVAVLEGNIGLLNKQKDIYFQYIEAQTGFQNVVSASDGSNKEKTLTIDAKAKNILFIDDEADKGWDVVLKSIFKEPKLFESVGKLENESHKSYLERVEVKVNELDNNKLPTWDLILLDLRLDETEDRGKNANKLAKDYSGANILDKIKKTNEGTQVIIFTASDKAWNMRELLRVGADGYYVKESPEHSRDSEFSLTNYISFKKQVEQCFEKGFLRELYEINNSIDKRLQLENGNLGNRNLSRKTVNLIKDVTLTQAFNAAVKITKEKPEYALYSFLEYYKISEALSEDLIQYHSNSNKKSIKVLQKGKGGSNEIEFISDLPLISKIKPIKDESDQYIKTYLKEDYPPTKEDQTFYTGRLSASLQFSALLLLKFKLETETVTDFMHLNNLRNKTVVHFSKDSVDKIMVEDIIKFASILEKAITNL